MNDSDTLQRAAIDRSLRHPVMFLLTAGTVWLAVALVLGVLASAKMHDPGLLAQAGWLTYGRIFPAHINALVYGWGMQAAMAMVLWLTARLCQKPCTAVVTIVTAGHIWNLGVAMGVIAILSGNGSGLPWMEFPAFTWPVMLGSYLAMMVWPFIQYRVRPGGLDHVAQWYMLGAIIWFPWVFTSAHVLLQWLPGHPVMAAGINAWYQSTLVSLFFLPVALGAASYLVPVLTGRPLVSGALAKLGFWSLAVIAPWAGMQKLAGAPLPYFLPYVGAAATVLLFVPVCAAATNLLQTLWPRRDVLTQNEPLRFAVAGVACLAVVALAGVGLNLPGSTLKLTQFSLAGYGLETMAMYGFFSLVMFGCAYWVVPLVSERAWPSRRMLEMHLLFSVYGLATVGLVALVGGLQQGRSLEDWQQPWLAVTAGTNPYAVAISFAWCLILFANVFFFAHLALIWVQFGLRRVLPAGLVDADPTAAAES